jgi:hypothetical protein
MPDRVYPGVHPMQAPRPNPPVNHFLSEPKPHQLPPPHHPMLPPRQLRKPAVITASPRKPLLRKG